MQRVCDVVLAAVGLLLLSPLLLLLWVGRHGAAFTLVKFRTMHVHTPAVATHLADASAITPWGRFLRRSKLDELPQLWNFLWGEMSLVGPRPCLFSQTELIDERESRGVFNARPGVTGLAQINGIDMSTPRLLAETDALMLKEMGLRAYFTFIFKTVTGPG